MDESDGATVHSDVEHEAHSPSTVVAHNNASVLKEISPSLNKQNSKFEKKNGK